jgi:hypothetical protein
MRERKSNRRCPSRAQRRWRSPRRRGVVSVVAMMFLVLFGSLAAAMAIMSRGNIVTAATHQHVMRAQGAAETGLAIAEQRLREAVGRLVVEKSDIDAGFGDRLWTGSFSAGDGIVQVIAPATYLAPPGGGPSGLAECVAEIHTQDANTLLVDGISAPTIGPAPGDADPLQYKLSHWVRTPAVALDPAGVGAYTSTAFQITYAPLASGNEIRVIVTGYDFGYRTETRRQGAATVTREPVTRTIMQDFRIIKRVNAAVLSPSRIMIGKNVAVEGDLGAVFEDVDQTFGDPLVMKSDFWGLEDGLDEQLTKLFNALASNDVDRDNRLRINHPIEGQNLPDYSDLGYPGAQADVTGDGYLDEFDVFIMYYDKDRDGQVVLSTALTQGTPAEGRTPEFVDSSGKAIDDDLALLIDSIRPDRNRNGEHRFIDNNSNGKFDPGIDHLVDQEIVTVSTLPPALVPYVHTIDGETVVFSDQVLGFRDGVIDRRDNYKKVQGRLLFRATESEWIAGQGDYRPRLRGSVESDKGDAPMQFGINNAQMPELSSSNFTNSQTALKAQASGAAFENQVAANLGVAVSQLATWTPAQNPPASGSPKYTPVYPDADNDGMPDNWQWAYFEKSPFNSPTYYDLYYRPVYENMVFRNVQIPIGNNGLFKNCTFIGVTFVRTYVNNTHTNWTIYGRMLYDNVTGKPRPDPNRTVYPGPYYPTMLSSTDRPVLMADPPLDKADIPADQVGATIGYHLLAEPLIINDKRVIDTKAWSNNIRFHDCLFVGGIVSDVPNTFTHSRNKLEFTGSTRFAEKHPEYPDDPNWNPTAAAKQEIDKSTMMLPNYSVDIGSFNSPPTQDVQLRGAIVAGVLDVRGNASIDGSLLLTFKPELGVAPLIDPYGNPLGNPAMFNATIGYFGQADGDDESIDPATLPVVDGVKIVGWDLNGDGLPDLGPGETPTPEQMQNGATPVPFHGYGRVTLRFDPRMALPDGIMLPLQIEGDRGSYREATR